MELIGPGLAIIIYSIFPFAAGMALLFIQTVKKESPVRAYVIMFLSVMLLLAGVNMALLNSWSMLYVWVFIVLGLILFFASRRYIRQLIDHPQMDDQIPPPKSVIVKGPVSMNEKVIIKSEMNPISRYRGIMAAISFLVFSGMLCALYLRLIPERVSLWQSGGAYRTYYSSMAACLTDGLPAAAVLSAGVGLLPMAVFLLIVLMVSKTELQVTEQRITYRGLFNRGTDIPVGMVCAVKAGFFHSIVVYAPSCRVRAALMSNRDEVYHEILKLMVDRHGSALPIHRTVAPAYQPTEVAAAQQNSERAEKSAVAAAAGQHSVKIPDKPQDNPCATGKCMMCGKDNVPVKTIEITIAGAVRKRTLCESCAAKRN